MGGGTGTSVVLSALKKHPLALTAILTMFDSGGSSGKLKRELGALPFGDVRQCITALAGNKELIPFFHYRFTAGSMKGHNFGNLFIAAIASVAGGLDEAIDKITEIMRVNGEIIPVTFERAEIVAELKNGRKIKGEEEIINCRNLSKAGIRKIYLSPRVKANPKSVSAIKKAEAIVIGPGKFYTSILPIFLVKDIKDAITTSKAKKIFICNLMTQEGNTDNLSVKDFKTTLDKYLGKGTVDCIVFNTGKLNAAAMKTVQKVFPGAKFVQYDDDLLKKPGFIGKDLLDKKIRKLDPSDSLVKGANQRTMVLHDTSKLAKVLLNLCKR